MKKIYIFGARATAVGLYKMLSSLNEEIEIEGFLISEKDVNLIDIYGVPVLLIDEVFNHLTEAEKREIVVYVAVPEFIHDEINRLIRSRGIMNIRFLTSVNESRLMEKYYTLDGVFDSVHKLSSKSEDIPNVSVYVGKFYGDKTLVNPPKFLSYIHSLYLGCYIAKKLGIDISGHTDFCDDTGDNISAKNPNRCEMTAHYWTWKNRLDTDDEYVGIYHYRRFLDMSDDDLRRMKANDVDVVLPFPMIHYPSALIHHTWYVREEDWLVMRQVLRELHPEYDVRLDEIFAQPYFYNYNIMIAKKSVFADYCAWLFPILDAIEERSEPRGKDRADRYTAYMSESLTTLYFMYHQQDLKIYHTGRLLFT